MDRMARWIAILLRAAKAINAITATLCILSIAIGLLVALLPIPNMEGSPDHVTVPPEVRAAPLAIGPAAVDDRLKPPVYVRVSVIHPVVDEFFQASGHSLDTSKQILQMA